MIKFFRHIRKSLLMENKTSKPALPAGRYFKYAIGEIILVVIGILIALQINTWNEQRKQDKLESEYYCRLLEDVDLDIEHVEKLIEAAKDRLKASNEAARLLQKDQSPLIEVGWQIALSIKAIYNDFRPNNAAFEDLKSGANLNIIKDKSIIKSLNSYFNNVEGLTSVIKVNGENAVSVYYAHDDSFANGKTQASLLYGRFIEGMERDVYDAITIDSSEVVSKNIKYRLYNEALRYISANTRQVELYNRIKDESLTLKTLLKTKCTKIND